MKNIFRGSFIEAMNINSLLEESGIEVFSQNENMATIQPWTVVAGGFRAVVLKVNEKEFAKAIYIIKDYENGNLVSTRPTTSFLN